MVINNKKGFLKMLEAIVAILIVFGFVVAVIPDKFVSTPKLPPDLEQTTNSILTEIQENPEFRNCVLGEESNFFGVEGAECIHDYIGYITFPTVSHPWEYGIRICEVDTSVDPVEKTCTYSHEAENQADFDTNVLPSDRNVYIKSITISVEDILGEGASGEGNATVANLLTIFAWSKT